MVGRAWGRKPGLEQLALGNLPHRPASAKIITSL
jgi:hypothetical protein